MAMLLGAVACFAALDTTAKLITLEVPLLMALWFRYLVQALATTAWVLPRRGRTIWHTKHLGLHLLRGLLLMMCTSLAFASLRFLPVGEFTAIVMTTPLVVTLLAAHTLGEQVSPRRLVLVLGGLLGTLVIVRPGGESFRWEMLLPVLLVAVNVAFQLLTSRMTRTEDAGTILFYTSWVGTLLATVPLYWVWVELHEARLWWGLLFMGAVGGAGHLLLIMAFERAPASALTPFMYGQIGFGMLGGYWVFGHVPDQLALVGIALIAVCGVAGGLLTVHENRVLRS